MKGDYPSPKKSFPNVKMLKMKNNIDKIFDSKSFLPKNNYSNTQITSSSNFNYPVQKSNRVELNDMRILSKYD